MFCCRPFEQYYVDTTGDVHLCCPQWIAMPIGNVLSSNPVEIWTNWVAKNVRKSIMDQSFRHCVGCPLLPGPRGCVVDEPPRTISTERVHMLTLSYDQTCNLACPSCRTTRKGCTPRAERIQEILIQSGVFNIVDRLCASGSGEPLASPLFWDLIDSLPPNRYPRLRLVLQTNGLLLTPSSWTKLGEYANRLNEISISVDASAESTYSKMRGGRWDVLMANIESVCRRSIPLQLNFVVQLANFREMPAFAELAKSLGARQAYFSALQNWDTYEKSEYLAKAVHLPSHPDHRRLLETLQHPSLKDQKLVTLAGLPTP